MIEAQLSITMSFSCVPTGPCLVLPLKRRVGDHYTCDIKPLISDRRFSYTWKGLIFYSDRNDFHTFLYDPRTCDKIGLTHFTHDLPKEFGYALSDKPTNIGCTVVLLHPDELYFWYYHIGGVNECVEQSVSLGLTPTPFLDPYSH